MDVDEVMPYWMTSFLKQDLEEEAFQGHTLIIIIEPKGRHFVWWLCRQFEMVQDGVIGQACIILERVLAVKLKEIKNLPQNSRQRILLKETLVQRVPLFTCVSIGLATKMSSAEYQVTPREITKLLAYYHLDYTTAEVCNAELNVLSMFDFCLPLFTNVEKALVMGADAGMDGSMLRALVVVTEITEIHRLVLQEQIYDLAFKIPQNRHIRRDGVTNIRHIHLVAGAVLATAELLDFEKDPVPRLIFLTGTNDMFLRVVGHYVKRCVINISHAVNASSHLEDSGTPARKRTLDEVEDDD